MEPTNEEIEFVFLLLTYGLDGVIKAHDARIHSMSGYYSQVTEEDHKAQAWLEYQPIRNLPLGRKALHNHFRSGGIVAIDRLLEAFKRTDLRVAVEAAQVSAALAHDEEAVMGRRSTKTGRLSSTQPNLQNVSRTLQNIADADEDEDE